MSNVRRDWYQTETSVSVDVMKRGLKKENVRVHFTQHDTRLHVDMKENDEWLELLLVRLAGAVDASKTSFRCTPAKVEVTLTKAAGGGRWESLEATDAADASASSSVAAPPTVAPVCGATAAATVAAYPTSHPGVAPKNWDKIEKEAVEADEKEQLDGDAAVNRLFQNIYKDASDETKRAMIKSFTESSGTVLSTNWNEVGQKKVDVKPPDSMEHKKWEQ